MTEQRDPVQEGRRLLEAATERPWVLAGASPGEDDDAYVSSPSGHIVPPYIPVADAALIVWAVNNAEALLDCAEALQELVAGLETNSEAGAPADAHDALARLHTPEQPPREP
jgi:hypothetical protein